MCLHAPQPLGFRDAQHDGAAWQSV
jgi:hypothetical protein